MATVSEIDGKLDELKRQAAALKEQRKVAAAKEREQARKWKAATLAAIGEIVLKTLGADWTDIDLEGCKAGSPRAPRTSSPPCWPPTRSTPSPSGSAWGTA